jgi:ABC-type uncharacterized transport system permease subunit
MEPERIHIEEIRKRAKDNKANNAQFFQKYSFDSLDRFRNTLFLATFALIGYLGAIKNQLNKKLLDLLVTSIALGLASYLSQYLFAFKKTEMYSELEKNLSNNAFPNITEYQKMINNEPNIYRKYKSFIFIYHFLQLFFTILQGLILIYFSKSTLGN